MTLGDSREGKEVKEKSRTYLFDTGQSVRYEDVQRIAVSDSGNHYLTLGDGRKVIVACRWVAIEFEGEWMA